MSGRAGKNDPWWGNRGSSLVPRSFHSSILYSFCALPNMRLPLRRRLAAPPNGAFKRVINRRIARPPPSLPHFVALFSRAFLPSSSVAASEMHFWRPRRERERQLALSFSRRAKWMLCYGSGGNSLLLVNIGALGRERSEWRAG